MRVVVKVFESLSDDTSMGLFTTIAHESVNSVILRNKVNITRKQYCARLSKMMKAGLIKRASGKLILTAFGKKYTKFKARLRVHAATYGD